MLRVLLISANQERFPEPVFPLGAVYVASALLREGMGAKIFDAGTSLFPLHSLSRHLRIYRPDVIGVSLRNIDNAAYPCVQGYTSGYVKLMQTIREHSSAPVFLGGSAFSLFPGQLMHMLNADGGTVGDGEEGMIRLCRGKKGTVVHVLVSDLHTVSFPLEIESLFPSFRTYQTLGIQTARGCPRRCIYCTYPVLEGKRVRLRPVDAVADELQSLYTRHGIRNFFVVDSTFNADENHMAHICRAIIARKLPIRFSCYLEPKMSDPSLFGLLSEAGCVAVDFGTDSGSEGMLRTLRKGFTVADVRDVSDACRRAGIDFCHSLLFGGPSETRKSVKETVGLMDEIRPKAVIAMTGIRIYPGTEMERIALSEGVIFAGIDMLTPRFYLAGRDHGLVRAVRAYAAERRNWFLPGERYRSSAYGNRMLRFLYRKGPLWRTFKQPRGGAGPESSR